MDLDKEEVQYYLRTLNRLDELRLSVKKPINAHKVWFLKLLIKDNENMLMLLYNEKFKNILSL